MLTRKEGETQFQYKVRLISMKIDRLIDISWEDIKDLLGEDCSPCHLRKTAYGIYEYHSQIGNKNIDTTEDNIDEPQLNYKDTTEILANGSHKSDKLVRMTAEQSKDVNYLLKAHGFDKATWELVNAKNNIWNVYSKQDGAQTLYSSKITVKPKTADFDIEKLIELISENVKQITIKKSTDNATHSKLLEIPLYDMHFGVSNLEYYQHHLQEIVSKIHNHPWEKILFVIGQDLLHNDNFKGQTANGTIIEKVDMVKAFDEALQFYTTLITEAIKNSNDVECIYVKGNHDESISYGLFRTLQATFPQVQFDGSLKQRVGFTWEKVFIGLSHGDKGANRIIENFMTDYGKLIANADVKEIHLGHLHSEKSKDKFGITQRTLSTANKTDGWHDDNGFIGANKRFQLFEYSPNSLDTIYYI
ncbi:hypothetical protein V1503_18935 [Bacillus sp. SCS-151]|uniref:hypothetical protein n=1 Tax=Nanhaiella sioensis TaxID=3115293 RepID=UPI00397CF8C3